MRETAKRAARWPPDPFTLALAGLAAVSGASILLRQTEFGPGLDWDAVAYICTARNLLAGEGYAGCGGIGAMEYWPPLYPMLLAAASLPGFDPHDVAGPFNATILGALVFAAGRWLRRNLASRPLAAAGCLAAAVSVPLAWISSYAMSESAFLLFSMLALIWADKRLEDGRRASLAWAAAFAALAWATRYAGVAVAAVAALALLLERRSAPDRKARDIWFYAAISAAPVCVWMMRNWVEAGVFFATPAPVDYTAAEILIGIAEGVGGWMAHEPARWGGGALGPHGVLGMAVLAFAAAATGYRGARALPRIARPRERSFLLFGGFTLVYLAFLAYSMLAGYTHHGVQPRFLLPVYLPLLFMALLEADRLASARAGAILRSPALLAAAAGLALWLSWGAQLRWTLADEPVSSSFAGPRWADSQVVRYVRDNPGGVVWTNTDRILHLFAGEAATIRQLPDDLAGWRGALAEPGDRIAWFLDSPQGKLPYDASDIHALPTESLLAAAGDGLVFLVGGGAVLGGKPRLAEAVSRNASPVADSVFDVHIGGDGEYLVYVRRKCSERDSGARFFLHVWPVRAADLPDGRRRFGFERLDFDFEPNGIRDGGACLAFAMLPEYDIARVATGQFDDDGELWRAEFSPPRSGPA